MILLHYYRSTQQEVRDAFKQDEMTVGRIEAEAERFAAMFGATPLYTTGFDSRFAGITFTKANPLYNADLWTKPTPENPVMVPRSPERAGAKQKSRAEYLYKQFHDNYPKHLEDERPSALLELLGIEAKSIGDNDVLAYREVNGISYLHSTLPLHLTCDMLEEITCSLYITGLNAMPAGLQIVSEEEALAAIAAQQGEASNG